MSIEALAWSATQFSGSAGAQCVLFWLCNMAGADGTAFPSIGYLASRSCQSDDSVRRRLRDLETGGFIERTERYRSNGSRSVDLYRVLLSKPAMPDPLKKVATLLADCEGGTPAGCEGGPPQIATTPLATCGGPEPSLNLNSNHTPHSPPAGGVAVRRHGISEEDGEGTQLGALISEFIAADPLLIIDRPAARRQWSRLTPEQQAQALAGVSRYLDRWRKAKFPLRSPSNYLKGRIWTDFAVAPAAALPTRELSEQARAVRWANGGHPDERWVFVIEGSAEWRAWREAFAAENIAFAGGRHLLLSQPDGTVQRSALPGRRFPMLLPPPRGAPAKQEDAAE